jgi:hypothetical protein
MFCIHCGHQLDSNNVCHNNSCPSNINNNYQNQQYTNNCNNNPNPNQVSNGNRNYRNYFGYNCDPNFVDKNAITLHDMIQFIGDKNTSFYIDKWTSQETNPSFFSWNWPAFFFSWIWLFYRKLNLLGALYFIIHLTSIIFFPSVFPLILFIGNILCAFLGNHLYIKHCIKKINSIKSLARNMDMNIYYRRLRNTGGESIAAIVAGIIIVLFTTAFVGGRYISKNYNKFNNHYKTPYKSSPKLTDPFSDYDDSDLEDSFLDDYFNNGSDSDNSLFNEPYSNNSESDDSKLSDSTI